MSLLLETDSGSAANITSELAIGEYTATANQRVGASFRLSGLNGASADFTIKLRHKSAANATIRDLSVATIAKPTATDTVWGEEFQPHFIRSGEKLEVRVQSSNGSDTSVSWAVDWLDAQQVDVEKISGDSGAADNAESFFKGVVAKHVSGSGAITYYSAASDTDAARGTAILAAQTAASDGTIYVYGDCEIGTSPLGKNGVNWHFGDVTITATGASANVLSDDGSAMSFSVFGNARFTATDWNGINLTGGGSVYIECQSIYGKRDAIIFGSISAVVRAREFIESGNDHDAIFASSDDATCRAYVETPAIIGGEHCVEMAGNGDVLTVVADHIEGSTASCVLINAVSTINITAKVIKPPSGQFAFEDSGGGNGLLHIGRTIGPVAIIGQRLEGITIDSSSDAVNSPLTVIGTACVAQDCTLLKHASVTNHVTTPSTATLTVIGSLIPEPIVAHASVTLNLSGPLRPTTAGRTLDVSATGEAGLDFDNIKQATGATTLNNITVPTVTNLTNGPSGGALSTAQDTTLTDIKTILQSKSR